MDDLGENPLFLETPMWKSWDKFLTEFPPVPEVGSSNIKMLGLAASSKPQNPTIPGGEMTDDRGLRCYDPT